MLVKAATKQGARGFQRKGARDVLTRKYLFAEFTGLRFDTPEVPDTGNRGFGLVEMGGGRGSRSTADSSGLQEVQRPLAYERTVERLAERGEGSVRLVNAEAVAAEMQQRFGEGGREFGVALHA